MGRSNFETRSKIIVNIIDIEYHKSKQDSLTNSQSHCNWGPLHLVSHPLQLLFVENKNSRHSYLRKNLLNNRFSLILVQLQFLFDSAVLNWNHSYGSRFMCVHVYSHTHASAQFPLTSNARALAYTYLTLTCTFCERSRVIVKLLVICTVYGAIDNLYQKHAFVKITFHKNYIWYLPS